MKINNLNASDYELYTGMLRLTSISLHTLMASYLKEKYDKVYVSSNYIYAVGTVPLGLLAHMDTVFSAPPEEIFYDRENGVIWSPDGCGHDDRSGIFGIYKLINNLPKDSLPSVILTQGEEVGGIGAEAFVSKFAKPKSNLKYLVQLDRRGAKDCVFYDCDNPAFTKYIERFGFKTAYGSFTDISIIAPIWGIAAVNLSIGYEDEHSHVERLYLKHFLSTLRKVRKMIKDIDNAPSFEYIEKIYTTKNLPYMWDSETGAYGYNFGNEKCDGCGKTFNYIELVEVEDEKEHELVFCPDCMVNNVDWCQICGQPFLKSMTKGTEYECIWCPNCYKDIMENDLTETFGEIND